MATSLLAIGLRSFGRLYCRGKNSDLCNAKSFPILFHWIDWVKLPTQMPILSMLADCSIDHSLSLYAARLSVNVAVVNGEDITGSSGQRVKLSCPVDSLG
jgi:hypothetical protein